MQTQAACLLCFPKAPDSQRKSAVSAPRSLYFPHAIYSSGHRKRKPSKTSSGCSLRDLLQTRIRNQEPEQWGEIGWPTLNQEVGGKGKTQAGSLWPLLATHLLQGKV